MKYIDVIVDISIQKLDRVFNYILPDELEADVKIGSKVDAPFGNRQITGYVVDIRDNPPSDIPIEKLKMVTGISAKSIAIDSELIELAVFLKKQYGCTMNQAFKTVLPAKRAVAARKQRVEQTILDGDIEEKDITLNPRQKSVVNSIIADFSKPALIHGVTGSGKTQVYMALIDEMISRGKQTILLIPEISLTFQNLKRFTARYGERIGVVNSRLSAGERYSVFEKARAGEIDVIIGPRSAVFTPFADLGLIIMDEEHETAYFSETTPRYKTSEVALFRCGINGAGMVFGSATPSIDTYYKAQTGEYNLFTLPQRAVPGSTLPEVSVIDLREELKEGNKTIFSRKLAAAIEDRLSKHEQIMLFLNRRGYAGFVSCRSCGTVMKCPHCDVSMTSHRGSKLICHYCGYEIPMPKTCPSCGSPYIASFGLGTEKLETMVNKYFPEAKVLRMDTDTTKGKAGHSKILSQFDKGKADILIGTQMIVKGHDFPGVTLVGIIAADLSLYTDDFRASERTFQLLTQAAGRAGRSDKKGEVIIQTYNPDSSVIMACASMDYDAFYKEECEYRSMLNYPPFGSMLQVLLTNESEETLDREIHKLISLVGARYGEAGIELVGPSDAGIKKIKDRYRSMFFIKYKDEKLIKMIFDDVNTQILGSQIQMDIL